MAAPSADQNISWIIMIALDHEQWTDSSGDACSASGNFSFVIGMSLRAASIRTGRKQIRVPTLSNMKGRWIVALGNGETVSAYSRKLDYKSIYIFPFAVWLLRQLFVFFFRHHEGVSEMPEMPLGSIHTILFDYKWFHLITQRLFVLAFVIIRFLVIIYDFIWLEIP